MYNHFDSGGASFATERLGCLAIAAIKEFADGGNLGCTGLGARDAWNETSEQR
jgi:hypothetical protein